MGAKIHNPEDVMQKLDQTICCYDGEPVFVRADQGNDNVTITFLKDDCRNNSRKIINHTDNKFSYKAMPLGYIFIANSCGYLTRRPDRQYRAGVPYNSVDGSRNLNQRDDGIRWYMSKELRDCILGIHVSPNEACELIESGVASEVPIHRHLSISKDGRGVFLKCRGELVGMRVARNPVKFSIIDGSGSSYLIKTIRNYSLDILV